MPTTEQLRPSIERILRLHLEKYQCVSGEVLYRPSALTSLQGFKPDGSEKLVFLTDRELGILLTDYCKSLDCAGLIIEIDLIGNRTNFHPLSMADLQAQSRALAEQKKSNAQEKIEQVRRDLQSRTECYGPVLADAVATKLEAGGVLGYGHRDYCGMGLEYRNAVWCYGEVWDGAMGAVDQQWTSRQMFVDWLANQSDASLANLERQDSFYWGNQTIERVRLQAWLAA